MVLRPGQDLYAEYDIAYPGLSTNQQSAHPAADPTYTVSKYIYESQVKGRDRRCGDAPIAYEPSVSYCMDVIRVNAHR